MQMWLTGLMQSRPWPKLQYNIRKLHMRGLIFCLWAEWQYVSRVVTGMTTFFQPLEVCIWEYFYPALIGIVVHKIDGKYRELLSRSVKKEALQYATRWIRLCMCMLP